MISGASEKELEIANDRADLLLKINQLQSNWNSLREYIKTEWNVVAKSPDGSFYDGYDTCLEEMKKDVLDKMNELEGDKDGIMDKKPR